MNYKDVLKEAGLRVRESDNPDRLAVDFSIEDENDNVAWVWGTPEDYEVECDHGIVEYDDDEHVGECLICGATCDWHFEEDNGNVGDYYWNGKYKVPHSWHYEKDRGGIIKQYVKEVYGRQQS